MRVANLAGRNVLLTVGGAVDVEAASSGRFPSDPALVLDQWDELLAWSARIGDSAAVPYDEAELRAPGPVPGQVFAVALNYRPHVAEALATQTRTSRWYSRSSRAA